MGKKLELLKDKETAKVEAVLELIRKQTPLTVKQVHIFLSLIILSLLSASTQTSFLFFVCIGKVL